MRGERIKTYYGGVVAYDDFLRHGKEGIVLENSSPEVFGANFVELLAKNAAEGNEFFF